MCAVSLVGVEYHGSPQLPNASGYNVFFSLQPSQSPFSYPFTQAHHVCYAMFPFANLAINIYIYHILQALFPQHSQPCRRIYITWQSRTVFQRKVGKSDEFGSVLVCVFSRLLTHMGSFLSDPSPG